MVGDARDRLAGIGILLAQPVGIAERHRRAHLVAQPVAVMDRGRDDRAFAPAPTRHHSPIVDGTSRSPRELLFAGRTAGLLESFRPRT